MLICLNLKTVLLCCFLEAFSKQQHVYHFMNHHSFDGFKIVQKLAQIQSYLGQ